MNGFAISLGLEQVFSDVRPVSDGSLYPALHKVEHEGWIAAEIVAGTDRLTKEAV
jgi:PadR family transcriptional regulator PadR